MSFDRNGDAGTAEALKDALAEIASGDDRRAAQMIAAAPPGPIETRWGPGFRSCVECLEYIRAKGITAPEGGLALPLPYTIDEQTSYVVVSSHALWRDPAQAKTAELILLRAGMPAAAATSYFPQVLRDARRIGEYYPGLRRQRAPQEAWNSARRLARAPQIQVRQLLRSPRRWSACSTPRSSSCCWSSSPALHRRPGPSNPLPTSSTRTMPAMRGRIKDAKNPGVNNWQATPTSSTTTWNDNSGRVRCRELLTRATCATSAARSATAKGAGRREDVAPVHVDQPRQADGRRWSGNTRSCSAPGRRSPTSPTSPTLPHLRRPRRRRPRASPTAPSTSGTGFPTRPRPRSRCWRCYDNWTDGSRSPAGHSTPPAWTRR